MTNDLTHWGIKGMKWGIRRFQNKDGSLTALGKNRKQQNDKPEEAVKRKKEIFLKSKSAKEQKQQNDKPEETVEQKKERVLKSKSAKELYKNADLFSDAELQKAYNRLMLEKNIANLAGSEISKGQKFVNNAIDFGKKANDFADTGIKTYNNVAKIYNSLSNKGKEDPMPMIGEGGKKKIKIQK